MVAHHIRSHIEKTRYRKTGSTGLLYCISPSKEAPRAMWGNKLLKYFNNLEMSVWIQIELWIVDELIVEYNLIAV